MNSWRKAPLPRRDHWNVVKIDQKQTLNHANLRFELNKFLQEKETFELKKKKGKNPNGAQPPDMDIILEPPFTGSQRTFDFLSKQLHFIYLHLNFQKVSE